MLLISSSLFLTPAVAEEPLSDIEQEGELYCLTEEEVIELAEYIETLERENELLNERLSIERQKQDELIESKQETINLLEKRNSKLEEQVEDLTGIIQVKDEQLELNRRALQLQEERINTIEASRFYDRATLIGLSAIGIALLLR